MAIESDYADNLRVYLIKFRKQTQYKHPITQEATDFDYDYLNDCATTRGADAEYDTTATDAADAQTDRYIYGITDNDADQAKTKLGEALNAIARDIKNWAGHEEAKNVGN